MVVDDAIVTDAMLIDGFDDALIGFGTQLNHDVAIYDYSKMVIVLTTEGLTEEEAEEHIAFNIAGAWTGHNTPVIMRYVVEEEDIDDDEFDSPQKRESKPLAQ